MAKRTTPTILFQKFIITIILFSIISTTLAHQKQPTPLPYPSQTILTEEWITRYNGIGNDYDTAKALALDLKGNIYVTGHSLGEPGETEPAHFDIVTIKYNQNGEEQWVQRWDNHIHHLNDLASEITVDPEGSVYVTGKSLTEEDEYSIVIIKYNTHGEKQWEDIIYGGHSHVLDYPETINLDGNGNVYISGSTRRDSVQFNICTIKYTPDGEKCWENIYNGDANNNDTARNIAVQNNTVVIVGETQTSEIFTDYITIKYNMNGELLWMETYDCSSKNDGAYAVTIDENDNIYITGASNNGEVWYAYDYATIKYTPDGSILWIQRYNALANESAWASCDYAYDITLRSDGYLTVTGVSTKIDGLVDYYATVCYSILGELQWADWHYVYRGDPPAITTDHVGNTYITGSCAGGPTTHDYLTIRYNATGEKIWEKKYNNDRSNYWDKATDIAVDSRGNIYVTGFSTGLDYDYDYTTIKYHQEEPPIKPRTPNPNDNVTNISLNPNLSWFSGHIDSEETVTYDVYFGNNSTPHKVVANQSERSYNPGTLNLGETYYWQIIAWDSKHRSIAGPLWRFNTIGDTNSPQVTITKPQTGMLYIADKEIGKRLFSPHPLIIGKITIEIQATDTQSGIKNIEIYIDGAKQANMTNPPYEWLWQEKTFFKHTITVIAYDNAGNNQPTEIVGQKFL